MATPTSRLLARPAKDEWGVYDPQQAGIAALVARLDARTSDAAAAPAPAVSKEISKEVAEVAEVAPLPRPSLKDAQ
jgi:hypothetical protein